MLEESAVCALLALGCFFAGVRFGNLRKAHALRSVPQGSEADDCPADGDYRRDDEAPAPGPVMRGVGHDAGGLLSCGEAFPTLDAGSEVARYPGDYAAVAGHIRTHIGHQQAADHDSAESAHGVGCVPDAHLGGQFTGRDPLRKHPGARRESHPLEILVEHDGHSHHQNQHFHELRAFVHPGDPVAQVHSEAEANIRSSTQDEANSHEGLGAHTLHHEPVQEAAQAINQRANRYHDTEAGIRNAVLGGEAGHGDGEVFPYKIINGIDHHRTYYGAPLPILERFVGHILSSVLILSICAFARRIRVRTVLSGRPVSSAISPYCRPSTSRIFAILR